MHNNCNQQYLMLCILRISNDKYSLFSIEIQCILPHHHKHLDIPPVFSLANSCQHSRWNLWQYNKPLNSRRATILKKQPEEILLSLLTKNSNSKFYNIVATQDFMTIGHWNDTCFYKSSHRNILYFQTYTNINLLQLHTRYSFQTHLGRVMFSELTHQ